MIGRAHPTWRHLAASSVGRVALLATGLAHPSPVRADLGSCAAYDGKQRHQGGFESAPTTSARGVYALILNKTPDLCNGPQPDPYGSWDSGSTAYAMLTNYSGPPRWYQVGWFRTPDTGSCSVAYMQYYDLSTFTTDVGPCVPAGVAYRYVIKNLGGFNGWAAYVLRDSDGTQVWGAPP